MLWHYRRRVLQDFWQPKVKRARAGNVLVMLETLQSQITVLLNFLLVFWCVFFASAYGLTLESEFEFPLPPAAPQ